MPTYSSTRTLLEWWESFVHLLYPDLCAGCNGDLPSAQSCFCLRCRVKLSPSDMHLFKENEFTQRLWGRLQMESAAAAYYFTRKSPIQRAIHGLKYHNKPQIGVAMGREFGKKLAQSPAFEGVEAIVPVPLHPRKERLRGYNQSAMFAQGLSETLGIPALNNALVRGVFSISQTRKRRMERFRNVGEVFSVGKPAAVEGKYLLLVDDVLTTGATLEVCGNALLEVPGTKVSVATIALAIH